MSAISTLPLADIALSLLTAHLQLQLSICTKSLYRLGACASYAPFLNGEKVKVEVPGRSAIFQAVTTVGSYTSTRVNGLPDP